MRQLLKSKKSAEMTIGTIIIIILALVVLIFLIYSFMKGGGSLMDTLGNFFAGGPNADTIKSACQAACTTQQVNSFCSEVRTLKLSDKDSRLGSCKTFSGLALAGIASCPDINCGPETVPKTCKEVDSSATWQAKCDVVNDVTAEAKNSETYNIKVLPYCCKAAVATTKECVRDLGGTWVEGTICSGGKLEQKDATDKPTGSTLAVCCK